jgi:hypothetical protein
MATLDQCVKPFPESFDRLHVIAKGRVKSSRNEIVFADHQLDIRCAAFAQPAHDTMMSGASDGLAGVIMP